MALHFDFTKVANNKTVCLDPDGETRPITEAIIFLTMAVDMGSITAKNVETFVTRLRMYEMATSPVRVSAESVRAHIGLTTNVSDTTDAAFAKKLARLLRERAQRSIKAEDEAAKAAAKAAEPAGVSP